MDGTIVIEFKRTFMVYKRRYVPETLRSRPPEPSMRSDVRFAREVVDACEQAVVAGRGAIQVRGRMIDRPMVERARALLARSSKASA